MRSLPGFNSKSSFFTLIILLILGTMTHHSSAQVTLFSESFDETTTSNNATPVSGTSAEGVGWTATPDGDVGNSFGGNGTEFFGRNLDHIVTWAPSNISIDGYTDVSFSITFTEDGDHDDVDDYIDVFYSTDGGANFTRVPDWNSQGNASHTLIGNFPEQTVTVNGLSGTSFRIEVVLFNTGGPEIYNFTNVSITGIPPEGGSSGTTTETYSTSQMVNAPAGVTSVFVSAWGAGGGGGLSSSSNGDSGAGGGGGGYAEGRLAVSPGDAISITIGSGGVGASSTFSDGNPGSASIVSANGNSITASGGGGGEGTDATGSNNAGGMGGSGSSSGTVTDFNSNDGGTGGTGGTNTGGGGGGGAGTAQNGGAGENGADGSNGGDGGTGGVEGGGNGGDSPDDRDGEDGLTYGGGGAGGGDRGTVGGNGADGFVSLSYICASIDLTSAASTTSQIFATMDGSPFEDITYLVGGTSATGATVSGLPTGLSGTYTMGTGVFTISGTPTQLGNFNYTVTVTVSGCTVPIVGGTVEVVTNLPIELLSFTGQTLSNAIQLDWTTATELNNDYMAIERSGDGVHFVEIGRVDGNGTTVEESSYQFLDEAPNSGLNYYRLRQVDYGGGSEYHKIISVSFGQAGRPIDVNVFPNPARDLLQLEWKDEINGPTEIRVFDIQGKPIGNYRIDPKQGRFELHLKDVPAGYYVLQMIQDGTITSVPFQKE